SRTCAPSSSHSPGATMKLGSSRGMDTKRPRGSERSKPCHELRLTRRSQPPYPWPPEQAQPGVSKPCRTTVAGKKGERFIEQDETPLQCDISKIPSLKPAFRKEG